MPTVPRQEDRLVRDAAVPSVRISPSADATSFGGGPGLTQMGNAAAGLLKGVGDIAAEEVRKADELAVLEMDRDLSQLENDLQYNQETGAMGKRGRDVFTLSDDVAKRWEKGVAEIGKRAKTPTQREEFEGRVMRRWDSLNGNVQRHVASQIRAYDDEVTDSFIQSERNAAVSNYLDPDRVALSIESQIAEIEKYGARNGLTMADPQLKEKADEAVSKTHVGVISRMLSQPGQETSAKGYFLANRSELLPDDRIKIESAVKEGTLRGESQARTDAIIKKDKTWKDRIASAKKIEDPELRDEVERRVKVEMAAQQAIERQDREDIFSQALNIVESSKSIDSVPPDMISSMDISDRKALRNYADTLAEGKKPVTNWGEYYRLRQMATSPDQRQNFLDENMMAYRGSLSDTEFKELVSLQADMRNGGKNSERVLDGFRSKDSIVNDALRGIGVDPSPKEGSDDAGKVAMFRKAVDDSVMAFQERTKRKADNKEVQEIVDTLAIKGIIEDKFLWFDKSKRFYELEDGDSFKIKVDDIPSDQRRLLEEALIQRGEEPSEDNIEKYYASYLAGIRNGR